MSSRDPASQTLPVYRAEDFVVTDGVAEGDALSFADELVMDDIYQLSLSARRQPLTLAMDGSGQGPFTIREGSETGTPGHFIYLDSCITLMATDSTTYEALVLVEVDGTEAVEIYLLPLASLATASDYRLVGADRHTATARFAEVACVSFARGTHITMASGAQVPIEELKVGDRVLTRDDGAQEIRWIGETTFRPWVTLPRWSSAKGRCSTPAICC